MHFKIKLRREDVLEKLKLEKVASNPIGDCILDCLCNS